MIAEATPPPPTTDPQVEFTKLREWVVEHCATGHSVRDSAIHMARSAVIHRLLKFGPDETLNTATARDLMALLVFTNGLLAEYLMRTAYIRSIIDGDHEIYEYLNTTPFLPEVRAWYWQIVEALMGRAPNPHEVESWIAAMTGEELSVARLIICRVYPDLALLSWLDDVPPAIPRLAAELCTIISTDRLKHEAIKAYLRLHPEVRYALPDGALP